MTKQCTEADYRQARDLGLVEIPNPTEFRGGIS
jgi:hypothetical protein